MDTGNIFLIALGLCTLIVWVVVLAGMYRRHAKRDLERIKRWRDASAPPCQYCASQMHTTLDHLRAPQKDLTHREE